MRKTLAFLLVLLICCTGCTSGSFRFAPMPLNQQEPETETQKPAIRENEFRGAWLSYTSLNPQRLTDESAYRVYLRNLLAGIRKLRISELFVQVRPFADSVYPSDLFASSACVATKRGERLAFDYFKTILEESKEMGLHVHAWINPYRVLSDMNQIALLKKDPVIGKWFQEPGGREIIRTENGVYLNPASARTQDLILNGIREILDRYSVFGLHLDDYFYPLSNKAFDNAEYELYKKEGGRLSLSNWRRENVNSLIRRIYSLVKGYDPSLLVSISPAANIEADINQQFADVRLWANESGYCDMIIPQIYFGFQNGSMPFARVAKQWRSLCKNKRIRLCAGLAAYKIGRQDDWAGSGKTEWMQDTNILTKQVCLLRQLGYDGFLLFSAEFVNFRKKLVGKAFQSLMDVV